MFDRVLLRSGQFILRKANIEIDIDSFRLLVEDALSVYNKAKPFSKKYNKEIIYPRYFTFDEFFDPFVARAPDWISEVTPIRYYGYYSSAFFGGGATPSNYQSELVDPLQSPWVYDKPLLTVPYSCKYSILAVYNHIVEIVPNEVDENGRAVYEVKTITIEDHLFLDLLRSMFLLGIGKSRRAFTMNDLPIILDADQIASEAKELEESVLEKLNTIQQFHLSMG